MANLVQQFGKHLRRKRQARGWTLRQLAKRCRMPHNTLFQIEVGETDPRISQMARLAKAFGEDLLTFLAPIVPVKVSPGNPSKEMPSTKVQPRRPATVAAAAPASTDERKNADA